MQTKRTKVFETNSSSVNSFCLGDKLDSYDIPEKICIDDSQCGRSFCQDTVNGRFSVLIYICDTGDDVIHLCSQLYKMGVKEIKLEATRWFSVGEIEDYNEFREILKDEEKIKRWLFNPESYISGEDDN